MVGVVAIRTQPAGRRWWIPLPLFLLWLVLLPLAAVWLPAVVIVSLVLEAKPWRVLTISWQLLAGLRDLRVQLAQRDVDVHLMFF
jgi:hypothetical protein